MRTLRWGRIITPRLLQTEFGQELCKSTTGQMVTAQDAEARRSAQLKPGTSVAAQGVGEARPRLRGLRGGPAAHIQPEVWLGPHSSAVAEPRGGQRALRTKNTRSVRTSGPGTLQRRLGPWGGGAYGLGGVCVPVPQEGSPRRDAAVGVGSQQSHGGLQLLRLGGGPGPSRPAPRQPDPRLGVAAPGGVVGVVSQQLPHHFPHPPSAAAALGRGLLLRAGGVDQVGWSGSVSINLTRVLRDAGAALARECFSRNVAGVKELGGLGGSIRALGLRLRWWAVLLWARFTLTEVRTDLPVVPAQEGLLLSPWVVREPRRFRLLTVRFNRVVTFVRFLQLVR